MATKINNTIKSVYYSKLTKEQRPEFMKAIVSRTRRHKATIYSWINEETRPSPLEMDAVADELNKILQRSKPFSTRQLFNS